MVSGLCLLPLPSQADLMWGLHEPALGTSQVLIHLILVTTQGGSSSCSLHSTDGHREHNQDLC